MTRTQVTGNDHRGACPRDPECLLVTKPACVPRARSSLQTQEGRGGGGGGRPWAAQAVLGLLDGPSGSPAFPRSYCAHYVFDRGFADCLRLESSVTTVKLSYWGGREKIPFCVCN